MGPTQTRAMDGASYLDSLVGLKLVPTSRTGLGKADGKVR